MSAKTTALCLKTSGVNGLPRRLARWRANRLTTPAPVNGLSTTITSAQATYSSSLSMILPFTSSGRRKSSLDLSASRCSTISTSLSAKHVNAAANSAARAKVVDAMSWVSGAFRAVPAWNWSAQMTEASRISAVSRTAGSEFASLANELGNRISSRQFSDDETVA